MSFSRPATTREYLYIVKDATRSDAVVAASGWTAVPGSAPAGSQAFTIDTTNNNSPWPPGWYQVQVKVRNDFGTTDSALSAGTLVGVPDPPSNVRTANAAANAATVTFAQPTVDIARLGGKYR